jgi:hypothetical protein
MRKGEERRRGPKKESERSGEDGRKERRAMNDELVEVYLHCSITFHLLFREHRIPSSQLVHHTSYIKAGESFINVHTKFENLT